ncbi:L,D-transpeptidase [Microbacterium sp. cx-55]|uniref:L,D-transpeptidase family protein n=1 Tax=Microbacterium sp. cx-55 TaxID=2875948 RepID=UPI001E3CBA88|nr:L,D-transpeptidase [Microbacterium sp. cx-55]UGB35905.1 L,D-transpeptidase [Microbacterium sp. cx-55]
MTDLVTGPTPQTDTSVSPQGGDSCDIDAPTYAWAPEEPAAKKRHLGLWLGIPGGVVAAAAAVLSLILIAPGTAVAGVPVGGLTVGAAADALQARLAGTTVELETADGVATVTGADLGATVDARALAEAAFAAHPMWNVTQWNSAPIDADVAIDATQAEESLRSAAGAAYVDPVDATVAFDAASASYVTTPATEGAGLDLATVRAALEDAFTSGAGTARIDATVVPVEAAVTTPEADAAVGRLNGLLDTVGFYVGDERTVPVDRAVAASWLTVSDVDGDIALAADAGAIQATVDTLPSLVDRAPVNATVVTNSAGETLRELTAGLAGRSLDDTSSIASAFAAQLAGGDAAYRLTVAETPFQTTALYRHIDVNLSTQRAVLYENDQVVQSWAVSSGLPGTATPTGNFEVFAHVSMQDMGCGPTSAYCTKDVPWVTYFAPDVGFHGAYWHNNFGNPMSHGCVNMPVSQAKFVFDWAPNGTEVSVHH